MMMRHHHHHHYLLFLLLVVNRRKVMVNSLKTVIYEVLSYRLRQKYICVLHAFILILQNSVYNPADDSGHAVLGMNYLHSLER
jgi:hypothetical protein